VDVRGRARPTRRILALLGVAAVTAVVVIAVGVLARDQSTGIAKGQAVPPIRGTDLNGAPVDLATLRGRPVIVNFWGPSCVPCREEMPLLAAKLAAHAPSGLVVLGVLMDDPVQPAKAFMTEYGAGWQTVVDPDGAIKRAYRVLNRPQSYFIDAGGILRSIQIGYLTDADFERQFALIAGGS
jgi:cytochrome c biogenesis protein CcmG/thiol:disulfide interchange protein DsbE